jgi:hypothetical protein
VNDDLHTAQWLASRPSAAQPARVLGAAVVTGLLSAALCAGAILAPAPAAVVPLVVAICIGCPLFAGWEVPFAVAALRAERAGGRVLIRFRRTLDQLPETDHPLGL